MKEFKQKIKCDVENCMHNDNSENLCELNEIDVSCTCEKCQCNNKKETICNSFKEKE